MDTNAGLYRSAMPAAPLPAAAAPKKKLSAGAIVGICIAVAVAIVAVIMVVLYLTVWSTTDKIIEGGAAAGAVRVGQAIRGGGSFGAVADDLIAKGAADDVMYGIKPPTRRAGLSYGPYEEDAAPAKGKLEVMGDDDVPEWVSAAKAAGEEGGPTAKELYLERRDGYLRSRDFNVAVGTSDFGFGQGVTEADDEREAAALAAIAASMDATGGIGLGGQKRPEIEAVKAQLRAVRR